MRRVVDNAGRNLCRRKFRGVITGRCAIHTVLYAEVKRPASGVASSRRAETRMSPLTRRSSEKNVRANPVGEPPVGLSRRRRGGGVRKKCLHNSRRGSHLRWDRAEAGCIRAKKDTSRVYLPTNSFRNKSARFVPRLVMNGSSLFISTRRNNRDRCNFDDVSPYRRGKETHLVLITTRSYAAAVSLLPPPAPSSLVFS